MNFDELGFHRFAGERYIYPNNMPIRPYQKKAVEKGLFHNAMIVLPTGYGKTFIAAVVMYNFWRWYPQGKLIFVAPTRPLVAQQIEECKKISGIPSSQCLELTGTIHSAKRVAYYKDKRVFFATPQVIENDLENNILPAKEVRCLVIDEAHRAQGSYAYVNIVRYLHERNRNSFRILALSATPGSDIERVKQVMMNLFISEVLFMTEGTLDLMSYGNEKTHRAWTVEITGRHRSIIDKFIEATKPVYKELHRAGLIFSDNIEKTPTFALIKAREMATHTQTGKTKGRLTTLCMAAQSMSYNFNLLVLYGIRPFYASIKRALSETRHILKTFLGASPVFNQAIADIEAMFGDDAEPNPNKITSADLLQSHPKLSALRDVLRKHFDPKRDNYKPETRVIVFTKFIDSVNDIVQTLKQADPLLFKPGVFVGQKGMRQKEQIQMVSDFRAGKYNILVATCVAEEGLDIGEVDLIVCFDTTSSPISNTQRRGRTGRKRAGNVETLLTKGYEENKLKKAGNARRQVEQQLYDPSNYRSIKYRDAPRMVPPDIIPVCFEQLVTPINDDQLDDKPKPKRRRTMTKKVEHCENDDEGMKLKKGQRKKKCVVDSDEEDGLHTLDMSTSVIQIEDSNDQNESPATIDQSQSVKDSQKTTGSHISFVSCLDLLESENKQLATELKQEQNQNEQSAPTASSQQPVTSSVPKAAQSDSDIEWESDLDYHCV